MIFVYALIATVLVMGVLSIFSKHHRNVSLMLLTLVRLLVLLIPFLIVMTLGFALGYLSQWTFKVSDFLYRAGTGKSPNLNGGA